MEVLTLPHAFCVDSRGLLVLQRDSRGTPPGLQVDFEMPGTQPKCTWSPGGVHVESMWSPGNSRGLPVLDSTWTPHGLQVLPGVHVEFDVNL